jgi:integrase
MAADILRWWGDKSLGEVNGRNCRAYVEWRTAQRVIKSSRLVGVETARHELTVLRAAIRYYHGEHGPLQSVPVVTLPPSAPPREDYFLTRAEVAQRIRVARRRYDTRHMVRMILLGVYTGSRPGALLKLRWLPSIEGGWLISIMRSSIGVPSRMRAARSVSLRSEFMIACSATCTIGGRPTWRRGSPISFT